MSLNKKSLLIFLVIVFSVASCRKSSNSTGTAPTASPSPGAQTDLSHSVGGNTTLPETKYFKGSIGDALDLKMKLVRTGEQLNGTYYYEKIGTRIDLRGTLDKNSNILLQEFDPAGKQTGEFKGLWQVDPADNMIKISGNWSKPPGDKAADKKIVFSIHEEPISFTGGEVDVVSKAIKENNKKLVYEIKAVYHQLSGGNNPNFEKFNQVVRTAVTKKVATFKKEVQPEPEEEPRPENSMGSDLDVSYKIELAQDDLISVVFSVSSYYQGAAHPNSYTEPVNYDLKNGRVLKLSDLFKSDAKYLNALSTYSVTDLKKQSKQKGADGMLDDSSINSGAGPSAKNYQSWAITKRGLGINFDAYQVGPYAAGPQYVLVPYASIKDLINPDGPIGQFAK